MKQQLTSSTGGLRLAGAGRQWEAVGGSGSAGGWVGGKGDTKRRSYCSNHLIHAIDLLSRYRRHC